MKRLAKIALFIGLAIGAKIYGSETQENVDKWACYNGTRITAENLVELAPKAPVGLAARARMQLRNNPDLIENALSFEPFIGTIRQSYEKMNTLLRTKGLKNYSKYNYNFPLPNSSCLFKIAGHFGRHHNLEYALGLPYGTALTKEHYKRLAETYTQNELDQPSNPNTELATVAPKTYQTVSRMAYWLLFDQYKKRSEHTIAAPATYLIHIPGRPTNLSDRNYVILEKMVPDLQDVTTLSQKEFDSLEEIVRTIKLFELHLGNLKRNANGNLVIVDLEQPNNTAPRLFFGKDKWKADNDARAGLESLNELKKLVK